MTYPQPSPTVSKKQVIIDLLISLGWNVTQETGYPLFPGPEILTSPDRAVFVTPTTGPGWVTEEAAMDCWGFQARLRGPFDDPVTAELFAERLDVMILNGPYNVVIDGVLVKMVTRASGPPSPLPLDPADRRFEYVCSYLITTGLE
jgi:hypothetical protein